MGALATGQNGEESKILKKLIPIILIIALVMGIINFILIGYFS
jgi:L-lactate permease